MKKISIVMTIMVTATLMLCSSASAAFTVLYDHCGPQGFKVHKAVSVGSGPGGSSFTSHQIVSNGAWPTVIRYAGLANSDLLTLMQPSNGLTYGVMLGTVINSVSGLQFTGTDTFPEEVCDCSGGHAQNSITPDWPKGLEKPKFLRGTGDGHPAFVANRNDTIERRGQVYPLLIFPRHSVTGRNQLQKKGSSLPITHFSTALGHGSKPITE